MGLLYLADLEAFPKAKIYHYSCLRHRKLMDIYVKLFSHYHLAVYGKKWEERLVLLEPGSMALTTRNTNFIRWYNHTEWSKYIILQSIFILVLQTKQSSSAGSKLCSEFSYMFSLQPWSIYGCLKVGPSLFVHLTAFSSFFFLLFAQTHLKRARRIFFVLFFHTTRTVSEIFSMSLWL